MTVDRNETHQLATLCAFIDHIEQNVVIKSESLNDGDFEIVKKALTNPRKPAGSHFSKPSL
jgi:hypothetical protein